MPTLGIDHDALARLRRQYTDCDTDSLLADQLRLHRSTVNRVLRGQQAPSNQFIAAVRKVFGTQWSVELFRVLDNEQ